MSLLLPSLFGRQVTSCFCGSKFCVRCAKGKKVQKQERCHLSRWRRPPTTSEKKKRLWISCLNFATTRVKKYANMLWNILTTNNSNITEASFSSIQWQNRHQSNNANGPKEMQKQIENNIFSRLRRLKKYSEDQKLQFLKGCFHTKGIIVCCSPKRLCLDILKFVF